MFPTFKVYDELRTEFDTRGIKCKIMYSVNLPQL